MECTQTLPYWLEVFAKLAPAIVSIIVGGFATCIGFNQYKTNLDKLRLDLFERRLEAYEKLQEYFNCLLQGSHVDNKVLSILAEARYESLFLFGDEITEHINEVFNKAIELRRLNLTLYGLERLPIGEERKIACAEESILLEWNFNQQNNSSKRYAKYLKLFDVLVFYCKNETNHNIDQHRDGVSGF